MVATPLTVGYFDGKDDFVEVPADPRLDLIQRQVLRAAPGVEGHNLDHFCVRVAPFDAAAISS